MGCRYEQLGLEERCTIAPATTFRRNGVNGSPGQSRGMTIRVGTGRGLDSLSAGLNCQDHAQLNEAELSGVGRSWSARPRCGPHRQ